LFDDIVLAFEKASGEYVKTTKKIHSGLNHGTIRCADYFLSESGQCFALLSAFWGKILSKRGILIISRIK
jgi:hypothetical protein